MNTLPYELQRKIFEQTAITPLRRLVLSNVRVCPAAYSPMYHELWNGLYGVRLHDGRYAVSVDSLPKSGVIWDESNSDAHDESAALMHRNDEDEWFCFDTNVNFLCMYRFYDNYCAQPIGDVQLKTHAMKSCLAAVCKLFSKMEMPRVKTTCIVPHKQRIILNDGESGSELTHTIILTESCDPDKILEYYKTKDEERDWEGSDAESDAH